MWILGVANQKGGVGKTTTAANLSGLLAQKQQKVLMLDLDPQGSLSGYFNIVAEQRSQGAAVLFNTPHGLNRSQLHDLILPTEFDRLSILPGSVSLATVDRKTQRRKGVGLIVAKALSELKNDFDFVIIDCPPMIGTLMINAMAACNLLIVPVQTEHLALNGLERMIETLKMMQHSQKKALEFLIVPTLYHREAEGCQWALNQLQKYHSMDLWNGNIPWDVKLREASECGLPGAHHAPTAPGVWAYSALLKSVLKRLISQRPVEVT